MKLLSLSLSLTFDRVALFLNMNLQFVLATHPTSASVRSPHSASFNHDLSERGRERKGTMGEPSAPINPPLLSLAPLLARGHRSIVRGRRRRPNLPRSAVDRV